MEFNSYPHSQADRMLQNQAQLLHRLQTSNSELSRYKGRQSGGNSRASPVHHHDKKSESPIEAGRKNEKLLKDVLAKRKKHLKDDLAIYKTDRGKLLEEREKLNKETEKMQASKDRWRIPNYKVLDPIESPSQFRLPEEPMTMDASELEAYVIRTEAKIPKLEAEIQRRRREVENMRTNPQHLEGWSYEAHQSQTYHMVRDILVEVADGIMLFEPERWTEHRLHATRVLDQEEKRIQEHKDQLTKERICQLLVEEIILEVSAKLSLEIAEENQSIEKCIRAMTQLLVINSAEAIATKKKDGREESDPAFSLVTGTYHQMVTDRKKKREMVWMHSQKLKLTVEEAEKLSAGSGDHIDEDIQVLHFQDAATLQDQRNDELPAALRIFKTQELEHWKNLPRLFDEIKVIRRTKRAEITSLSPDHRLLAVGYSHGDILVYDLWTSPVQLRRLIGNQSIHNDPVISLKWSLNGLRLISINESGALHMWSIASGGVNKKDLKDFEVTAGRANTVAQQMTLMAQLGPDDYKFRQGPLAEGGAETTTLGPSLACFYPSQTLLGTQNEFVVGFDNGDILKCNIEPLIAAACDEPTTLVNTFPKVNLQHQPNYIGQDIPADLFRCHEHSLVVLGCIGNRGNILSVDIKGYINVWEYSKKHLSHFGWFEPVHRYRLVMDEKTFVKVDDATPQVVFNESEYKSKKRATQKVLTEKMKEDRKQIEKEIAWLKLRTIGWHRKLEDEEGIKVEIWRPQHVPTDGCDFHVIIRDAMNSQLVSYTRVKFKEKANGYLAMLDCKLSADGNLLVFMLLFKECPPKDAHISFVFVDVPEMKVRPYRIKTRYKFSALEFTRCLDKGICSFQISRPYNMTGAAYIFVKVLDFLHVYSIESGALVVQTSSLPSNGLNINPKHFTLEEQSMIDLACAQGSMTVISYGNKESGIKLVDLSDHNNEGQKYSAYAAYKVWKPDTSPSNTWLWLHRDLLDGHDNRHVEAYFRRVILQLVDFAIQQVDGKFDADFIAENEKRDRMNPFYLKKEIVDEGADKQKNQDTGQQQETPSNGGANQ